MSILDDRFGGSLLDKSTANPGNVNMSIFEKKPKPGQGTVSSDYLKQTRADNPAPSEQSKTASVTLSHCAITTDPEKLATDQPFEMSVDVTSTDGTASGTVTFNLFCILPKPDGTEEIEDESSPSQGRVKDGKAIATGKLFSPKKPVKAGTKLKYYVVAQHPNASAKAESPKVDVEASKPPQPLAVWSLGPAHFRYGSSFPLPSSCQELSKLQSLLEQYPNSAAAIFGHSDALGDPATNRTLSGRRTSAVHSLLTRDLDGWLKLAPGTKFDPWEHEPAQIALSLLKDASGSPYYGGAIDGVAGPKTITAIKGFQKDNGLKVDGIAGPNTKSKLYSAYMDAICPVKLKINDFVGDPPDSNRQWACCACGDANPALVLSRSEQENYDKSNDKTGRRLHCSPNQRTSVFLFPQTCKGAGNITFPCPAWTDKSDKCQAQMHEDAATRQKPSTTERSHEADKDTYGCKFYNQIATIEKKPVAAKQEAKPTITTLHLGIFNDGTGNSLDRDMKTDCVSNIGKLYQRYAQTTEGSELWDANYVHGIGTDGDSFDGLDQGIAGGFGERIDNSLRWLHDMVAVHPDAELKLYIFGFSRGAAQARALVNELFRNDQLARYKLAKTKITVELLAIFDTVGSIGVPGQSFNFGFDLRVYADRVTKVIHLCAQSEVRANFDLWSIRCPPDMVNASAPEEYLKTGPFAVGPEDWEWVRGTAPMPNPDWEEWILPAMHSDVGGGYGPNEWIPDLPTPLPQPDELINHYVYRVMDERTKHGWTPRGLVSNQVETKEEIEARVRKVHEDRYRQAMAEFERVRQDAKATGQTSAIPERLQSMPVLRIPGVRQLNNDLARLALAIMLDRTTKVGVRWMRVEELRPIYQAWFQHLPSGHLVNRYLDRILNLDVLESTLQTGLDDFRQLVAEYFHDSRWFLDLPRRKRDVYFGGRK